MATQYDEIARAYDRLIGGLPVRQLIEYTYRRLIGDVRGKSVLDLACGNGFYTRIFKEQGASRVLGVDLSAELIAIAREHEAAQPLGMEYRVGDGSALGKLGDFDIVTTAFLLNYAPTREALLAMSESIAGNLRGDRFVAINLNVAEGGKFYGDESYFQRYGVRYQLTKGSLDGQATVHMTIAHGADQAEFDVCHLPAGDYEWALRRAGFSSVRWHNPEMSPAFAKQHDPATWKDFLTTPSIVILECQR